MAAVPETLNLSLLARQYVANGWALVPIDSGTKGPLTKGWNLRENCVTTVEDCRRIRANVGLAHAYSGTAVLDFDDMKRAADWLRRQGVDFDEIWNAPDAVKINSGKPNHGKLLYRLPAGVTSLPTYKMDDGALELRCASANGRTVQDVLPPSVHPERQVPYEWEYDDLVTHWSTPPVMPAAVLKLWQGLAVPTATLRNEKDKAPMGLGRAELRKLVFALDPNCEHDDWVDVGFALHHETRGGDIGLEIWDEWSSHGDKYEEGEPEYRWGTFGQGYAGQELTIRTLMARAGVDCADDFDDLPEPEAAVEVRKSKFAVMGADEFSNGEPQSWIIKGLLPRAQIGMLYGMSTAGKSFITIDMLGAIARGVDWRGMRTKPGRVVLVAAEGQGGVKGRLRAYAQHHDVDLSKIPFGVIADVPDMFKNDHKALAKQIKEWGGADVIVLDTLAQSSGGANENSGEDMGKVLAHCRALHEETGAMVLLVHHAGKDLGRGARGWSGLKAAMDVEIEVVRALGQRSLKVSKAKDGKDGEEMRFKLHVVEIGMDEDGDPITSCVIEHSFEPVAKIDVSADLTLPQKAVLQALTDDGVMFYEDLKRAAVALLERKGKSDNRPRDVANAIEFLVNKEFIARGEESMYSLVIT